MVQISSFSLQRYRSCTYPLPQTTFAGGWIICILMHWHFLNQRDIRIFITFNNCVARGNVHKSAHQHQSQHAAEGGVCVWKMHIYTKIIKSCLNLGQNSGSEFCCLLLIAMATVSIQSTCEFVCKFHGIWPCVTGKMLGVCFNSYWIIPVPKDWDLKIYLLMHCCCPPR